MRERSNWKIEIKISGVSRKEACPKDGALSFNKVLNKLHVVLNEAINFENDKKIFLKMRFLTRKI